jgi:hypothetical protein
MSCILMHEGVSCSIIDIQAGHYTSVPQEEMHA